MEWDQSDLMPHEKAVQARRAAQAAAGASLPPPVEPNRRAQNAGSAPVPRVAVVRMVEHAACGTSFPRNEACPACGRRLLLEG
jgi:hypothetical protein